jgi:hypothetical protein
MPFGYKDFIIMNTIKELSKKTKLRYILQMVRALVYD